MQTKADVVAAIERRLPTPVNMGVVGNSIVVVLNMKTEVGAACGLLAVADAVSIAFESVTAALSDAAGGSRH